jgi:hypothetical protein
MTGVSMLILTIGLAKDVAFEKMVGERAFPYIVYVIIGCFAIGNIIAFRKMPAAIGVAMGGIGWLITFAMLYYHFSHQQ